MFKEENGQLSMRRVLAFIFGLAAIALSVVAMFFAAVGWYIFIPAIACLGCTVLLLFFTTWADVAAVATAIRK